MKNYFDLENRISDMLKTSEDLYDLFDIKYQDGILPEDVTNAILGIMEMHKVRQQKLFNEFKKLFELGCLNNKTQKIRLPNLSNELMPHFIRGYFDGDGSIYKIKKRPNSFSVSI